ncbi:DNA repair protein RecO, partial [bacterium]|nr:DNA repair protein RecO [bacterium]
MSHHIYQTRGFVVGSTAYGEADKLVHLFTEDLGLVSAIVKSVREARSKLKCSLQDFTYARLDLVRGKEMWRMTDAEEITRLSPRESPDKVRILAGIFSLLRRFVHGEERDAKLFETLHNIFFFLKD